MYPEDEAKKHNAAVEEIFHRLLKTKGDCDIIFLNKQGEIGHSPILEA